MEIISAIIGAIVASFLSFIVYKNKLNNKKKNIRLFIYYDLKECKRRVNKYFKHRSGGGRVRPIYKVNDSLLPKDLIRDLTFFK